MAINIQLKDFAAKSAPVPADIVYLGNSTDSFNEVQSTIAQIIAAYPALASIASLTTVANEYIYTTAADTYAVAPLTSVPTASILAQWDANKNLSSNNSIQGFLTQATAGGTTVLTVASAGIQEFTGSTTQTVTLPVAATLVAGQTFTIINSSSGIVTVNSSGGNLVQSLAGSSSVRLICVLASGTTAASWKNAYTVGVFPLTVAQGGTGVSSVTTAPTATAFAGWDANSNLSANSLIPGFATQATAGGTTVLTVASKELQEFTGTLTQTVTMPVVSTLVAGQQFTIINNSSGAVTVNSSGGNAIQVMAANTTLYLDCVLASGTTAASWNSGYVFDNGAGVLSITGTANQVIASASTGAVVLSLPQDIQSGASPVFNLSNCTNVPANTIVGQQIFTSGSGTYTPTAGTRYVWVRAVAGGGGGGGCTSTTGQSRVAGGGGSGGYGEIWEVATSRAYAVGGGGAAGTAGNTGTTGGSTTFGTAGAQLNLAGGVGGTAANGIAAGGVALGGLGGAATTATLGISGGKGFIGFSYTAAGSWSGNGAASPLGAGGSGSGAASAGSTAGIGGTGYGSGGGGGACFSTAGSAAGGSGSPGIIIITEYA